MFCVKDKAGEKLINSPVPLTLSCKHHDELPDFSFQTRVSPSSPSGATLTEASTGAAGRHPARRRVRLWGSVSYIRLFWILEDSVTEVEFAHVKRKTQ